MLTGPMTNRRSDAKTAYGLMSDIRQYILEEPKRIWMKDWLLTDKSEIEDLLETDAPVCGTVGCIAGNAVVLSSSKRQLFGDVEDRAFDLLSGDDDADILSGPLYELFHTTDVNAKYGTRKYARIVAKRIEKFQEKYGAALRAVRL